jgi:hypothetical protein
VDSTAEAVEAATAMKYRAGYVLCTFGITATLGLTIAYILNLVQYQNEIGSVGFAFSITVLSAVFVTRRWTSAIEATSAAETVYENVIIRPRQIKYVGIAGLLLTIIQYVVEGAIPSIVYTLIGLLVFIGVFLAPMIYILTQTYDVSFKALWRKTQQG